MQSSDIPVKFPIPFANAAGGAYIRPVPTASQLPGTPGAASLTDGFTPVTFLDILAGGIPPDGRDVNGLLKQMTAWLRWEQSGAPHHYDSAFSTAIGGYPLGAVLTSEAAPGIFWISTAENNASNPDTGGADWTTLQAMANTWTGVQSHTAPVVLSNNTALQGKNTSGTAFQILKVDVLNKTALFSGSGGFRVSNDAGTIDIIASDGSNNLYAAYKLRAGIGAIGSGDANAATLLGDFTRSFAGTNNGYTIAPDGTIDQTLAASVPVGGGRVSTLVTLPLAFPNQIHDAIISFLGTTPPSYTFPGSIAVQPWSLTQVMVTTDYAASATAGVVIRTRGN